MSELLPLRGCVCCACGITVYFRRAAEQQLLPVPYPEELGPNAQIGGGNPGPSRHQHLLPDPVPQSLGPNALGNPKPWHRHRQQHLLPTRRQYHRWR